MPGVTAVAELQGGTTLYETILPMRNISIIEDQEPVVSLKVERVIDKILGHLGIWQTNQRPPAPSKSLFLLV